MKLTRDRIVDASMAVFGEVGYHGLSMRQVADRLDVHAGSLYYHVRDKNALLRLMADRVAQQAYDAGAEALAALPVEATWQDKIHAQADALRSTIASHPGGAVLLAGSPQTLSAGALGLMERMLSTLDEAGVPVEDRVVAADTLLSHVTGFVLQEQTEPVPYDVRPDDLTDLAGRFPLTFAEAPGGDQDDKFAKSVRLLCAGIRTTI
ncbi:TetR/AcrR family transcriptional regulator [Actinocrispum wychmicini]|uniref:TetR family transcriptional regulator n=1 Tax=Actinocrispum wychmicini TaxID=1213861 RepID=A0A4R2JUR7_9PSEU|nr:TetR/AcrR family transcriptional regulator C-terminal domain-containing protein [Actinocrispum wychmicini]TCO62792.1 TetR family transcriptional regulator [Actinocrispum wychmicini]